MTKLTIEEKVHLMDLVQKYGAHKFQSGFYTATKDVNHLITELDEKNKVFDELLSFLYDLSVNPL